MIRVLCCSEIRSMTGIAIRRRPRKLCILVTRVAIDGKMRPHELKDRFLVVEN